MEENVILQREVDGLRLANKNLRDSLSTIFTIEQIVRLQNPPRKKLKGWGCCTFNKFVFDYVCIQF